MDAEHETGIRSTKDSQSQPVVDNEEEQHKIIETYQKLQTRTESGSYSLELGPDQIDNVEGSSNHSSFDHFDVDPEILKKGMNLEPPTTHPEITEGSSSNGSIKTDSSMITKNHSSEHLEAQPKTVDGIHLEESPQPTLSQSHDQSASEGNDPRSPIIKMDSFSSSSESSSEASLHNGPFPGDLNDDFNPRSHPGDDQLPKDTVSDQTKSGELQESSSISPVVASPGSEITLSGISPIQSPPIQVMQRSEGYDPDRIPSSIFQRSSSDAHNDWSIASNESLFSIHVGASASFSREQAALISEMRKAEDQIPEPFSFTPQNHPSSENPESPNSPTAFPVSELADADTVGASPVVKVTQKQNPEEKKSEVSLTEVQSASESTQRDATEEERDSSQKKGPTVSWRSTSISNFSDRSHNSTTSFAFPILSDEARLESSSSAVVDKEEQRGEMTEAGGPQQLRKPSKRRWYRLWCSRWKRPWCSSSCRCLSCWRCCRC